MNPVTFKWVERVPFRGLRVFGADVQDGQLRVLVGQEPHMPGGKVGWHMSISHGSRIPTWEEIHAARYQFCPNESHMAIILPPAEEYVNAHPFTMHLFEVER